MKNYHLIVIGAGPAGFFSAINTAERKNSVLLLEKTKKLLSKVKISGGGRCNVTHACFDPLQLTAFYPRGSKELYGPFHRFGPKQTIDWFAKRGVKIKKEVDGRMFPVTDSSQTIIDCLVEACKKAKVKIKTQATVCDIEKHREGFKVFLKTGEVFFANKVMLATGSHPSGHSLAKKLGHQIVLPVPSLFTFNISSFSLASLAGISVEDVEVVLPSFKMKQKGPLLITHWGFSGPAVLKLSAFCARKLYDTKYNALCTINWVPSLSYHDLIRFIKNQTHESLFKTNKIPLPKRLYQHLLSQVIDSQKGKIVSKANCEKIIQKLIKDSYQILGKTTYKKEFVTCGGVNLSEVNFKTMESKKIKGLYFGGEILDIDGVTGGFNFQAAWTTGWLAALDISKKDVSKIRQ